MDDGAALLRARALLRPSQNLPEEGIGPLQLLAASAMRATIRGSGAACPIAPIFISACSAPRSRSLPLLHLSSSGMLTFNSAPLHATAVRQLPVTGYMWLQPQ